LFEVTLYLYHHLQVERTFLFSHRDFLDLFFPPISIALNSFSEGGHERATFFSALSLLEPLIPELHQHFNLDKVAPLLYSVSKAFLGLSDGGLGESELLSKALSLLKALLPSILRRESKDVSPIPRLLLLVYECFFPPLLNLLSLRGSPKKDICDFMSGWIKSTQGPEACEVLTSLGITSTLYGALQESLGGVTEDSRELLPSIKSVIVSLCVLDASFYDAFSSVGALSLLSKLEELKPLANGNDTTPSFSGTDETRIPLYVKFPSEIPCRSMITRSGSFNSVVEFVLAIHKDYRYGKSEVVWVKPDTTVSEILSRVLHLIQVPENPVGMYSLFKGYGTPPTLSPIGEPLDPTLSISSALGESSDTPSSGSFPSSTPPWRYLLLTTSPQYPARLEETFGRIGMRFVCEGSEPRSFLSTVGGALIPMLSFKEIKALRLVSREFWGTCENLLNNKPIYCVGGVPTRKSEFPVSYPGRSIWSTRVFSDTAVLLGLKCLDLCCDPGVTDANLALLSGKRLESLKLKDCLGVTGAGLAGLTGLKVLHVINCPNMTDSAFSQLGGLTELHLDSHRVGRRDDFERKVAARWPVGLTDSLFYNLCELKTLKLRGSECPISDTAFKSLSGLRHLTVQVGPEWPAGLTGSFFSHLKVLQTLRLDLNGFYHRFLTPSAAEAIRSVPYVEIKRGKAEIPSAFDLAIRNQLKLEEDKKMFQRVNPLQNWYDVREKKDWEFELEMEETALRSIFSGKGVSTMWTLLCTGYDKNDYLRTPSGREINFYGKGVSRGRWAFSLSTQKNFMFKEPVWKESDVFLHDDGFKLHDEFPRFVRDDDGFDESITAAKILGVYIKGKPEKAAVTLAAYNESLKAWYLDSTVGEDFNEDEDLLDGNGIIPYEAEDISIPLVLRELGWHIFSRVVVYDDPAEVVYRRDATEAFSNQRLEVWEESQRDAIRSHNFTA